MMQQAFDNLNPGGYIELYDPMFGIRSDDGTLPPDSALAKWDKLMLEASYTAGCYLNSPLAYKQQLIAAGFTDVTQVALVWPTNTWPKNKMLKTIGLWVTDNMSKAVEALTLHLFTNVLGWSVEETQNLCEEVKADLQNRRIHAYWPVYAVYGRKPE